MDESIITGKLGSNYCLEDLSRLFKLTRACPNRSSSLAFRLSDCAKPARLVLFRPFEPSSTGKATIVLPCKNHRIMTLCSDVPRSDKSCPNCKTRT